MGMGDNITDISEVARQKAEAASKAGSFNFLDRLANRNYPTEDVQVYLDEAAGYRVQALAAEIADEADDERLEQLEADLRLAQGEMLASRFVFHLEGISSDEYDDVVDAAREQFPIEYTETRNPLTFALERTPVENEERETFFRAHLWAKFIRSVEAPGGEVDDNITPAWCAQVQGLLPIMGALKIQTAIETLRMTTDWMDRIQDENFLAKS